MANNYGVKLSALAKQARNLVRDLDPSNDLTFLRVTCKKYEMMIAPDKDYFLIVVQSPEEEAAWMNYNPQNPKTPKIWIYHIRIIILYGLNMHKNYYAQINK